MTLKNKYVLFITLILGNIFFFFLSAYLLNMQYEENDDIIMCLIANGKFTGIPDCHLVFQNALYGVIISSLYKLTNSIEWYSIAFVIIHILSMSVIVYNIVLKCSYKPLLIAVLLSIYSIWCVIIQSFQFTTTAGILCIAGCIMLLSNSIPALCLGYFAIFIASLIRFEVVVLVGLLFFPLIILTYKFDWKRYLYIIGVAFLVMTTKTTDRFFYQTAEWEHYRAYNALRGKINDNPNINVVDMDKIESVGISERDYVMLCGFIIDPNTITLPILKQVVQILRDVPLLDKIHNTQQLQRYRLPTICLFMLTILLVCASKSKFIRIILIFWYIGFIILLGGLCLDHYLKNRVFLCAIMAMLAFLFIMFDKIPFNPWHSFVMIVCLLGISTKYFYQCYKVSNLKDSRANIWYEQQKPLINNIPSNAYVLLSELNIEGISPFDIKSCQNKIYPTGWLTTIPLNRDIGHSLVDILNENVYILSQNVDNIDGLINYLTTQYDINIACNIITKNEYYSIIQLKNHHEHILQ